MRNRIGSPGVGGGGKAREDEGGGCASVCVFNSLFNQFFCSRMPGCQGVFVCTSSVARAAFQPLVMYWSAFRVRVFVHVGLAGTRCGALCECLQACVLSPSHFQHAGPHGCSSRQWSVFFFSVASVLVGCPLSQAFSSSFCGAAGIALFRRCSSSGSSRSILVLRGPLILPLCGLCARLSSCFLDSRCWRVVVCHALAFGL